MNKRDKLREQFKQHLTQDEVKFVESEDGVVEFEVSVDNINYERHTFFTDLFVVLYTLIPLNITNDNIDNIYKLINYLNCKVPFGNFEFEKETSSIYYRISAALEDEDLSYPLYEHLFHFPLYTISQFLPYLNGVNSALLSLEEAENKINQNLEKLDQNET